MNYSFLEIIRAVADVVLKRCKVVAGLALVENADDETGLIEAVAPEQFFEREQELLKLAIKWLPRLPFRKVDLLIVDRIGKNISGTGMDTNVIGRKYNDHVATENDDTACKRVFVRGLTEETHGNACGIGMAEFTNQRTIDAVDRKITAINALTGGHPTAAMLPIAFPTDREVIAAAQDTCGLIDPPDLKVIHIGDTLHLREVLVSEAYLPQIRERSDLEILSDPVDMAFDADGNLIAVR